MILLHFKLTQISVEKKRIERKCRGRLLVSKPGLVTFSSFEFARDRKEELFQERGHSLGSSSHKSELEILEIMSLFVQK